MLRFSRLRLALATLALVTGLAAFLSKPAEAQICPHFFCFVTSDCYMFCPSARVAGCVDNVCYYNF